MRDWRVCLEEYLAERYADYLEVPVRAATTTE
jgi:hypothetical protein